MQKKTTLILLLVLLSSMTAMAQKIIYSGPGDSATHAAALAQKHTVYADAGISLAYFDLGGSVTYNYKVGKKIGLGVGVQAYTFHTTVTNTHQFTPAAFAEIRYARRPLKKTHSFGFLDLGIDFYKHNNYYSREDYKIYTVPNDNGFYAGWGFGFIHCTSKRHGGPYASLKMITNWYGSDRFDLISYEKHYVKSMRGTFVVSAGFKF